LIFPSFDPSNQFVYLRRWSLYPPSLSAWFLKLCFLQRSNAGTKQRKELIDEINSRYGKYLENQLTEQSTTEDIAKALEIVNEKLHENIVLKFF